MVPTKNLVGHQRLRLTSRKPLLSLQHAVDVLLNNLYTNLVLDLVLNVGDLEFSFSFPFRHRSYSFANQLVGPK